MLTGPEYLKHNPFVFAGVFLVLIAAFFLRLSWLEPEFVLPKGEVLTFTFTVKSEPKFFDNRQLVKVGDSRIYTELSPKYSVGDRLKVSGKVDDSGRIFNAEVEKIGQKDSVLGFFSRLRFRLTQNIASLLPSREATLVVGSVLGVDDISSEFRDQLTETGTIHVVVVSGQNLTIVAAIFLSLSKYIGRRKSLVLACFFVFLYALLAGFEPPVVRASLMVLASSFAVYFGRESNAVWNLFIAALVILFVWPGAIFEISFQLTFAASFGIMTLGKRLSKAFSKVPVFGENAAVSTSAYLFTAPVVFYHFGRISPLSPFVNVLVAEAVFPIMVFGFLTAISSLIFMPLAQLFAYFAYVPALYFVKVVELFSKFT